MPTPSDFNHFLPALTSPEIRDLPDKDHVVVVQPLAAIEQHGPHLPVYTDSLIAEAVLTEALKRLPAGFPVWRLPLLSYGKSTEHLAFAGTLSLSADTLIQTLKEIGHSLAGSGFRRMVILNAHGGNTEIVDFVIRDIRAETGLMVFALHPYLRVAPIKEGISEQEAIYGIHAGDIETSILLAIRPDWVRFDLAPRSFPAALQAMRHPPFMGPLTFAWLTQDIAPDGVLGDATLATAEKGQAFLAQAADQVAELLQDIRDFKFSPHAS
jgi:creatinine amidohydrolase